MLWLQESERRVRRMEADEHLAVGGRALLAAGAYFTVRATENIVEAH